MALETDPDLDVPLALCLGGVDPSAGAGVLRDVMTLSSMGIYPFAVPTAETVQNGAGCLAIRAPAIHPVLCVEALRPHLKGKWGVKLGLNALPLEELADVCSLIHDLNPSIRIWDPILAPSLGIDHLDGSTLRRMAGLVLSRSGWVVCPNLLEARALAGITGSASSGSDPRRLAEHLLELGASAVWIKGGHGEGNQVQDVWVDAREVIKLGAHPRLAGERRGTGCTLASAWLGFRLKGEDGVTAAVSAANWLRDRWGMAFAPGHIGRPCLPPGVQ